MHTQINLPKMGGVAAVLASTLAFSSSASAVNLIGNLPQTSDVSAVQIAPNVKAGFGFTLPTGSNYKLDDIVLRLGQYYSLTDTLFSTDTPLLRIYKDTAKTSIDPKSATLQTVTFTKPTSSSDTINSFTFTPTSPFTFLADTSYWLELSNSTGLFSWRSSNPTIRPTGIPGITFNRTAYSFDSGFSYIEIPDIIGNSQINVTAAGAATALPEPTSLPGYIVLLGGLLAARKIVKSRTAKKVEFK
jgi:hypothetical protein